MIYYLIFSSLIFATYLRRFGPEIERFIYMFFILVLFIFTAFRFETGCDWANYIAIFSYDDAVYFFRDGGSIEVGYSFLMIVLKKLNFGFLAFNISISLIFFSGLNALAQRNINPLFFLALAFPILIIQLPMSGSRQAAAFGFLCFSSLAFIDKKPLRFLIFTILATSFHSSAILFILLMPFIWMKLTIKNMIGIGVLSLPILSFLYNSSYGDIYTQRYLEGDIASFGAYFRVGIILVIGLYFILFMRQQWEVLFPRDYQFVLLGSIGMIATFLVVLPISTTISDRLGLYLWIPALIILARIQNIPSRFRQLMLVACFASFFLMFSFWSNYSIFFARCYDPYQIKFSGIEFLKSILTII
ncbi:MAG: EpsG family protein [Rickettsiales bacterium TMED289]|nr:MAG: EpsG family protein [Rickettsiales bacterium TMED289]|tara:strand:- start:4244 stop:5320 length:1077 start_codon:yes stop_codon:yes gene_type:complete